jgi:DNA (cytosine-5)-methyltransferase 1
VARDIIDFSLKGTSIFNRKKPLRPNTLRRIEAGLRKFGGPAADPFILMMRGTGAAHLQNNSGLDEPLPTITTSGKHHYLCQPFIIGQQSRSAPRPMQAPVPTIACKGAISLVNPVIIQTDHTGGNGLCARSADQPVGTVVTKQNIGLVQPFIVPANHGFRPGRPRVHDLGHPLPTVTCQKSHALVEPFLVKYYGTGGCCAVDSPLDTVTTKDRFLLVEPTSREVLAELDILFRMLQPRELAAAHSFPDHYLFMGTKEDQTKQIGNSVPVKMGRAHLLTSLKSYLAAVCKTAPNRQSAIGNRKSR